ncbi:hypothetical protein SE92_33625 [Bradyrhizobium sp. AT1]|nr:hypothetical protein SE92_33625 [Bradyrhizobium sp. AT1]
MILNLSRSRRTHSTTDVRDASHDYDRYRRLGFIGSGASGYAERDEKAFGVSQKPLTFSQDKLPRYQGRLAIA